MWPLDPAYQNRYSLPVIERTTHLRERILNAPAHERKTEGASLV